MQRWKMRPQKFITRSTVAALLLASCAVLLLRSSPLAHAASPPPHRGAGVSTGTTLSSCSRQAFAVYPSPNVSTTGGNGLSGIAASASNDIWAVGDYIDDTSGASQTLIEHYTGSTWSVVASPNPGGNLNVLTGISLLSSTNIWAVGYQQTAPAFLTSLVEHWDGSQWSVIPSANASDTSSDTLLYAVSAISASDGWAVGHTEGQSVAPFIEHWDGSSWSVVPGADLGAQDANLYGVASISSTDVWAVGQEFDSQTGIDTPLVEHWDGTAWSLVSTPSVSSGDLFAVTALSSTDVWAVGDLAGATAPPETLIEHWDGTAWSIVPSPSVGAGTDVNGLQGIAASSASDVWAVGQYSANPIDSGSTLVLHWNGTAWSIVPSANPPPGSNPADGLAGVVALSPTQVWTVGSTEANLLSTQETLIEHAVPNPAKLMCPR